MENLKVDRTKLVKVSNYAKQIDRSPQRVYQLSKEGKIKIIQIDGIKFVELT